MSEESTDTELAPEPTPEVDNKAAEEAKHASDQAKLAKKFRLITGEEVLLTKRPSTFAFLNLYVLGIMVLAVHLLFEIQPGTESENPVVSLLSALFYTSGEAGLTAVMLFITWMNRLMNVSTSGRWVTVGLLLVTLAPTLFLLDDGINWVTGLFMDGSGVLGILPDYNSLIAGPAFVSIYMALVFYYQRSFHYAITSDAIIFEHSFLLSRSHRRILFDRISEVVVERSPSGTLLGFATVTVLTDSGVGIVEESNVPVINHSIPGTTEKPGDSAAGKAGKGLIRTVVGLMTYQRTIRTIRPDPKHCMYNIRKWEKAKGLLNEMHKKNSQSHLLSDLKKTITETASKD
ncbi:MAG: PH domain-containing protein [Candidatus Poseidoniaceae archaeon]|nr:PH domain-containing protein [Candidatus Poseidoniaceae archaeon]